MEAVHVLDRRDRPDDPPLVHVVGQRQLDEDAGHPLVGVQVGDEPEQLVLGRVGGELVVDRLDAHLLARLLLAAHVERRGWSSPTRTVASPTGRPSASTSRATSPRTWAASAFPSIRVAATAGERNPRR